MVKPKAFLMVYGISKATCIATLLKGCKLFSHILQYYKYKITYSPHVFRKLYTNPMLPIWELGYFVDKS